MNVYYNFDEARPIKNPVVTIGSFDGVHIGHKVIINRLNALAKNIDGESVLITFHPHPRKVLYPESVGKELFLINTQREKIELLRKAGLNNLFILEFTISFSKISSFDFVRNLLVGKLHAKIIVVGFNHNFGHNREGNYEYLYELGKMYGFNVEEIPEQDIEHEAVSSTRIRKALIEGFIQRANAYLDHHYVMIGKLTHNSRNTNIAIEEECKLIPPEGSYATYISIENQSYKALVSICKKNKEDEFFRDNVEVGIHCEIDLSTKSGNLATILFYKQIDKDIQCEKPEKFKAYIASGLQTINELIY